MLQMYLQGKTTLSYHGRALQGRTNPYPALQIPLCWQSDAKKAAIFWLPLITWSVQEGNCLTALQFLTGVSLMSIHWWTYTKPITGWCWVFRDISRRSFCLAGLPSTLKDRNSFRKQNAFRLGLLSCPISSVFEVEVSTSIWSGIFRKGIRFWLCAPHKASSAKHEHCSWVPNIFGYKRGGSHHITMTKTTPCTVHSEHLT